MNERPDDDVMAVETSYKLTDTLEAHLWMYYNATPAFLFDTMGQTRRVSLVHPWEQVQDALRFHINLFY